MASTPWGGCLPILIQLPVFVALYQALLHSIELRHAAFITYLPFTDTLWLADLSAKDPFYITPIIMGSDHVPAAMAVARHGRPHPA